MDRAAATGFFGMIACWIAFAFVFFLRKRFPQPPEKKRDRASYWGMTLQGVGFGMVWTLTRPFFSAIVPMPKTAEIVMAGVIMAVGALSVWLCVRR